MLLYVTGKLLKNFKWWGDVEICVVSLDFLQKDYSSFPRKFKWLDMGQGIWLFGAGGNK